MEWAIGAKCDGLVSEFENCSSFAALARHNFGTRQLNDLSFGTQTGNIVLHKLCQFHGGGVNKTGDTRANVRASLVILGVNVSYLLFYYSTGTVGHAWSHSLLVTHHATSTCDLAPLWWCSFFHACLKSFQLRMNV